MVTRCNGTRQIKISLLRKNLAIARFIIVLVENDLDKFRYSFVNKRWPSEKFESTHPKI